MNAVSLTFKKLPVVNEANLFLLLSGSIKWNEPIYIFTRKHPQKKKTKKEKLKVSFVEIKQTEPIVVLQQPSSIVTWSE